jgi:hypothetical protein
MSRGYTLLETVTVLVLLGTITAALTPAFRHYGDTAAVVAARESVVGLITRARVAATGAGGSTVHLRATPSIAWLSVGGVDVEAERLEHELGVVVDLGGRDEVVLSFDALGIGRVASATLRFKRGRSERTLVVAAYGRVRRE